MIGPARSSRDASGDGPTGAFWLIVAAPAVWLLVFILAYVVVASACARLPSGAASIGVARTAALVLAVMGVVGIVGVGLAGWRRIPARGGAEGPRPRERFVGWSTVLLSGLSVLAVLYVILTLALFGTCE